MGGWTREHGAGGSGSYSKPASARYYHSYLYTCLYMSTRKGAAARRDEDTSSSTIRVAGTVNTSSSETNEAGEGLKRLGSMRGLGVGDLDRGEDWAQRVRQPHQVGDRSVRAWPLTRLKCHFREATCHVGYQLAAARGDFLARWEAWPRSVGASRGAADRGGHNNILHHQIHPSHQASHRCDRSCGSQIESACMRSPGIASCPGGRMAAATPGIR